MRRVIFRLAGVVLGLLAGLVAAEIVLRVLAIEPLQVAPKRWLCAVHERGASYRCYDCYASNPNGELAPLPDITRGQWELWANTIPKTGLSLDRLRETPWCVAYTKSGLDLRDEGTEPMPPPGVMRICGIGDSFAMGEGVPLEHTLFRRMADQLGVRIQIVNAAASGYDTALELRQMRTMVPAFHCERALVIWVPNDVALSGPLLKNFQYINDLINVRSEYLQPELTGSWYAGHLRSLELLGSFLDNRLIERETIQWYRDCWDPNYNKDNLEKFRADLTSIARFPGCRTALVLYPLMQQLDDYPLQPIHDHVAAIARELQLPCLDLTGAFARSGAKTAQLWVHPVDHHPNGRAHEIAAKAIVEWLRRDLPSFLH